MKPHLFGLNYTVTSDDFMEILHVAAECFPVAKAGGLGDVIGALPKVLIRKVS